MKIESFRQNKLKVRFQMETRVRIAYKLSAKGQFQPDVTSEAENVDTAMDNLKDALVKVKELAKSEGALIE
jgi:hypothetical protein